VGVTTGDQFAMSHPTPAEEEAEFYRRLASTVHRLVSACPAPKTIAILVNLVIDTKSKPEI
jgi:hypothetical protein